MTRSAVIWSRTASGATSRTTRVRPPTAMLFSAQLLPPTWKSGMATMFTQSAVKAKAAEAAAVWASRLRWVSMAPLGKPVVPEVYSCRKQSSGPARCSGSTGSASASHASY